MVTFISNVTVYSKYLRCLRSAFKPAFDHSKLAKMMPYPRGFGMRGPPARNHFNSRNDYNNDNQQYDTYENPNQGYTWAWEGGQQPAYRHRAPGGMFQDEGDGYETEEMYFPKVNKGGWRREYSQGGLSKTQGGDYGSPQEVNCGELRATDIGKTVHMTGRVQYQRLNMFISLRDSFGTTQLVASDNEARLDVIKQIKNIPVDSHIEIIGKVWKRPEKTINTSMATGEIEVGILRILDVSAPKRKFQEISVEEGFGRTGKRARSSILITSAEIARCENPGVQKKFQERKQNCGELNEAYVGLNVFLCGWVESKRTNRFVILRDGYGAAQLDIDPANNTLSTIVTQLEPFTLVFVKGEVKKRPDHQQNPRMSTGRIEVKVSSIEVINPKALDTGDEQTHTDMDYEASQLDSGPPSGDVNSYTGRTHTCGQLRGSDVGREVMLFGWLDSHRGCKFATIRDGHGSTQLLIPTALEKDVGKMVNDTPLESVIRVTGTVCARPPDQVKDTVPTGEVEVVVKEMSVLNTAKADLPFIIREHNRPKEPIRMKYRYLDLRFTDMQHRLRLRSQVLMRMREFLINHRGFVEVETPTLFRRTPGGAQEYVVPTRMEDKFYSLVQSPQQLKQLLMVGAIDRYFQVARCYRDEGARPDRQPEFTQMDIELSFTNKEAIMTLIEELLQASWPQELAPLQTPFPVLTYHDAMHQYGSDKPDLSFDHKLIDISSLIDKEQLAENVREAASFTAKALVFGNNNASKLKASLKECEAKPNRKSKLISVQCPVKKGEQLLQSALPFVDIDKLKDVLQFSPPCTVVVGVGKDSEVLPLLGKLRQDVFGAKTSNFHFSWVVDFPLFLEEEDGTISSAHHPFTQPVAGSEKLLETDPLQVKGQHFDLVLNGYEIGGGSVRIHDPHLHLL